MALLPAPAAATYRCRRRSDALGRRILEADPNKFYVREGGRLCEAPAEDVAAAGRYAGWEEKGRVANGVRVTIMSARSGYSPGEPVHVIHVVEFTEPGATIHAMGPKPIYGEWVDGRRTTPEPPGPDEALAPALYDGVVLPSPGIDSNYEITSYHLEVGEHEIVWRPGGLSSNTLKLNVRERPTGGAPS